MFARCSVWSLLGLLTCHLDQNSLPQFNRHIAYQYMYICTSTYRSEVNQMPLHCGKEFSYQLTSSGQTQNWCIVEYSTKNHREPNDAHFELWIFCFSCWFQTWDMTFISITWNYFLIYFLKMTNSSCCLYGLWKYREANTIIDSSMAWVNLVGKHGYYRCLASWTYIKYALFDYDHTTGSSSEWPQLAAEKIEYAILTCSEWSQNIESSHLLKVIQKKYPKSLI